MSKISRLARTRIGKATLPIVLFVTCGLLGATGVAAAAPQNNGRLATVALKDPCGYFPLGMYRHCDGGTGSTVMLDVEDIWGNIFLECVGPGVTDLQPGIRWRVIDAWWNGGVGCMPGFYGPA